MDYDKYYINKNNLIFSLILFFVALIAFFVARPLIMGAGYGNNIIVKGTIYEISDDKIFVSYEDVEAGVMKDAEFVRSNKKWKENDKIKLYYNKFDTSKVEIVGVVDPKILIITLIILLPMVGFSFFILFKELYKLIRVKKFKKEATLIEVDFLDLLPNDNLVMCKGKHPIFLMEYDFKWNRFNHKQLDMLRTGTITRLKVWVDNYDANKYLFEELKTK